MNIIRIISGLFHFDRTNWKAVSLCTLAAAVFWIFNAFNKTHSTSIQFPLTFEYNHERFAPAQELPQKISINVSGNGWDLFTKYFGFKLPHLLIRLERPNETKKLVGTSLVPALAGQMGNLHINHILTDTLRFQFDMRDHHTFKLVADLSNAVFEKGYGRVSPIVILPGSVSVDGPQSLLHDFPDSLALEVREEGINSNYKSDIEIDVKGRNFISFNPRFAKVIFEVGRVEEVQKRIPFLKKNSKDTLLAWFQIPLDKVSSFESESEQVVATIEKAHLRLLHLPKYAVLLKTDPAVLQK